MYNKYLLFLIILLLIKEKNKVNIKFNVKDENNGIVKGALIKIKPYNSREVTNIKTCSHGSALLKGVPKNTYEVTVCKKGYKEKRLLVRAYKNITCNVCLSYYYNNNRLYGYITDSKSKPIDNAIVVLYEVVCEKVYIPKRFTYTDFTGEYNFFNIPNGKYIIKAIK
ncbi:hypothetical protein [Clostridium sp.]|uniref:hypothetical protein n=1 Tax=Clostridium sp. TaxID=1506 RepID=UPI00346453CC